MTLLHSTLALTEQGEVLGVLGSRSGRGRRATPRVRRPRKAGNGCRASTRPGRSCGKRLAAGAAAPPRLMHLMDREGDVYEILQWVEESRG